MFTSIILIIGGLLACYGLIISQAPHLKDEFDKVIPYQGFLGIILIILGLIDLFMIGKMFTLLGQSLFFGILALIGIATKFILGFVLSYGLVTKYILTEKSDAQEKTKGIYNTLIIVQVPFGIIAIIIGLIGLVVSIIY